MTRLITATAPGKLVLVGEYAVLAGAPALSAAVDRRAAARISAATGTAALKISNSDSVYPVRLTDAGKLDWLTEPGTDGNILAAAVRAVTQSAAADPWQSMPDIELDTRDFFSQSAAGSLEKIGIGSSAALTVALVSAIQRSLGVTPDFHSCFVAHRIFQHGQGSGIDIATSWYGGVIAMQPDGDSEPQVSQLAWPQGLHVQPVWSGVSASTTAMLARLEKFKSRDMAAYTTSFADLSQVSTAAIRSWRAGEAAAFIAALDTYGGLLADLDKAAGIGIWSDRHLSIERLARQFGVGYKPSGAGGGDFGLAYALDAALLQEFRARLNDTLVTQDIDIGWDQDGVRVAIDDG